MITPYLKTKGKYNNDIDDLIDWFLLEHYNNIQLHLQIKDYIIKSKNKSFVIFLYNKIKYYINLHYYYPYYVETNNIFLFYLNILRSIKYFNIDLVDSYKFAYGMILIDINNFNFNFKLIKKFNISNKDIFKIIY